MVEKRDRGFATTLENWHKRLAHIGYDNLDRIIKENTVDGLHVVKEDKVRSLRQRKNDADNTSSKKKLEHF